MRCRAWESAQQGTNSVEPSMKATTRDRPPQGDEGGAPDCRRVHAGSVAQLAPGVTYRVSGAIVQKRKRHREAGSALRHEVGSACKLRREIAAFAAVELPILLGHHAVPLHRVAAPEQRRYRPVRIPLSPLISASWTFRHELNACHGRGSLSHGRPSVPKVTILSAVLVERREPAPTLALRIDYLSGRLMQGSARTGAWC